VLAYKYIAHACLRGGMSAIRRAGVCQPCASSRVAQCRRRGVYNSNFFTALQWLQSARIR
jgi:hypothetical protein